MSAPAITRVLIAAGGTGGHIFPAIALGEALRSQHPGVAFDFLCGERELERKLYAGAGFEPIVFPARTLGKGLAGRALGLAQAGANFGRALSLIGSGRYGAVVGFGGYVTGPAVAAGWALRRRVVVHEANAVAGKANRWLAPFCHAAAVHFQAAAPALRRAGRVVVLGMPIRESTTHGDRAEAARHFGLSPDRPALLIIGGSQGAKHLYATLIDALPALTGKLAPGTQILWAAGAANFDELSAALPSPDESSLAVKLVPFIDRMDLALALAAAAIARAGASTVAELLACRVPAAYVPYPHAVYDHQRLNAEAVARAGCGEVLMEATLTPATLADAAARVLAQAAVGPMDVPESLDSRNAARRLADLVLGRETAGTP